MEIPILLAAFGPNFNTSHVYINPAVPRFPISHLHISIHLMFILIVLSAAFQICSKLNFNTSHVYINRGHDRGRCEGNGFQYISCLY